MNFHKFLKIKVAETGIELTAAANMMDVNYKSLYTRIKSDKIEINELLQLSDIYNFSLEDMKEKIDYKKI